MDKIEESRWNDILMTVLEFSLYADADRESLDYHEWGSDIIYIPISDLRNIYEAYKYLLQENEEFFEKSFHLLAAKRFLSTVEFHKSSIYAHNALSAEIRRDILWVYMTAFFMFFRHHVSRTGKKTLDDTEAWNESTESLGLFECSEVKNEWIQDVYELSDDKMALDIEFYVHGFEGEYLPSC